MLTPERHTPSRHVQDFVSAPTNLAKISWRSGGIIELRSRKTKRMRLHVLGMNPGHKRRKRYTNSSQNRLVVSSYRKSAKIAWRSCRRIDPKSRFQPGELRVIVTTIVYHERPERHAYKSSFCPQPSIPGFFSIIVWRSDRIIIYVSSARSRIRPHDLRRLWA